MTIPWPRHFLFSRLKLLQDRLKEKEVSRILRERMPSKPRYFRRKVRASHAWSSETSSNLVHPCRSCWAASPLRNVWTEKCPLRPPAPPLHRSTRLLHEPITAFYQVWPGLRQGGLPTSLLPGLHHSHLTDKKKYFKRFSWRGVAIYPFSSAG